MAQKTALRDADTAQPPKTLRYQDAVAAAEQRITDALPELVDALITRAKEGDTRAAQYLIDRVLGRATAMTVAPADDHRTPLTEEDAAEAAKHQRAMARLGWTA